LPAAVVSPDVDDSLLVLCARADDATTAAWCDLVRAALAANPGTVVSCDVSRLTGSAVDVLNALAQLQLTALHRGGRLRILRADPALCALLDLTGLADVLAPGEPEQGKEPGI
jgi:anti-anti-sigma regulatory factor